MPKSSPRRNAAEAKKRRFLKGIIHKNGHRPALGGRLARLAGNPGMPDGVRGPGNIRTAAAMRILPDPKYKGPPNPQGLSGPAIHFSTSVKRPFRGL
jgi:hypothetical protein